MERVYHMRVHVRTWAGAGRVLSGSGRLSGGRTGQGQGVGTLRRDRGRTGDRETEGRREDRREGDRNTGGECWCKVVNLEGVRTQGREGYEIQVLCESTLIAHSKCA